MDYMTVILEYFKNSDINYFPSVFQHYILIKYVSNQNYLYTEIHQASIGERNDREY